MVNIEELEWESSNDIVSASLEELVERKELMYHTIGFILSLKKKYRDVLIYRLFFEMSFHEISKIMQMKENSAKVIYYRGKTMVREKMEKFWNE